MAFYASAFESVDALDKLEGFSSQHGAAFYGLPTNTETVTLTRTPWTVPNVLTFGRQQLVPLYAGRTLHWQLQAD